MIEIVVGNQKKKTYIVGKVLRGIPDFLCAALGAAAILMLLLYLTGYQPYVVQSGSMEPAIPVGSFCFVDTKAEFSTVKAGDVIAFKSPGGSSVTHRVLEITEEGLVTKGDNNAVSDGVTTTEENFIGINTFFIPYVGYAALYLKSRKIRILLGSGLAAAFIVTKLVRNLACREAGPGKSRRNTGSAFGKTELQEVLNE